MYSVCINLFVDTLVWTFWACTLSISNIFSSPTTVLHMNGEWKHITSLEQIQCTVYVRLLYSCAESRVSQCWCTLSGLMFLIRWKLFRFFPLLRTRDYLTKYFANYNETKRIWCWLMYLEIRQHFPGERLFKVLSKECLFKLANRKWPDTLALPLKSCHLRLLIKWAVYGVLSPIWALILWVYVLDI